MASFSSATRELVLKLVYYGPGLGGKTTTLKALHSSVRAEHRGKMISLATPVDRTLYFDFLPVRLPSIGDMQLRLQLFTVPGQVYFNATRKLVLTGADGIVFVADSQPARMDANTESLNNLRDNLVELGRTFETVPIVLAYNKRDLPGVLSIDEMDRELNSAGFPSLATAATSGAGVFETLDVVVRVALDDLRLRRVIPSEVEVPSDGLIAARLADVRLGEPAPAEPTRIVTEEVPRTQSAMMAAVNPAGLGTTAPAPPRSAALVQTAPPAAPSPLAPPPALPLLATTPAPAPAVPAMSAGVTAVAAAPGPAPIHHASYAGNGSDDVPRLAATAVNAPSSSRRGSSLSPLFHAEDQETVRTIEDAMAESIIPRAILLLEALMVRVLENTARALGRGDATHESIAWALGIPAERYARVRAAAQRARRGGDVSRRDALEAYVLVAMAQIAADSVTR